jgi:dTDP-4-dehydrorhamnose reductase
VRSAWLFGPGGRNFVDTILDALSERPTLDVVQDQVGSPTYAPDLAAALITLVERGAGGRYHVVNAGRASWFELARRAAEMAGEDPTRILPATTEAIGRPAPRPAFSVLDATRARLEHGIDLRPWEDALREHVRHAREGSGGRSFRRESS